MTRKLVLLAASLLLSLLFLEVALRLLGFHGSTIGTLEAMVEVDDPVVDFRLRPSASWTTLGLSYRTNSSGFRDDEHPADKPTGTVRILVLGDSVTNGYGVDQQDLYAKELERELRRAQEKARFEVPVIALGALNTPQEAHLLRREGLRLAPDLVVVGYVLNDGAPDTLMRRKRARAQRNPMLRVLKENAARSSVILHSYRLAQRLRWKALVWMGREQVDGWVRDDYYAELHHNPISWERVTRGFAEIRALTEPSGTPVVVVIFPVLFELQQYRWSAVHQQVRAEAEKNGFHVLDLRSTFEPFPAHQLQVQNGDHVHPNAFGHRLAGAALYRFLEDSSLLPRSEAAALKQVEEDG